MNDGSNEKTTLTRDEAAAIAAIPATTLS